MARKHKGGGTLAVIEKMYSEVPAFTDIFTEESFYTFAFCFAGATVLLAFILSRFITLRPVEM